MNGPKLAAGQPNSSKTTKQSSGDSLLFNLKALEKVLVFTNRVRGVSVKAEGP